MTNLARTAYEAYCKSTGGVSLFTGDRLPEWENIGQTTRVAWDAAAGAVADQLNLEQETNQKDPITMNPSGGVPLADLKKMHGGLRFIDHGTDYRER